MVWAALAQQSRLFLFSIWKLRSTGRLRLFKIGFINGLHFEQGVFPQRKFSAAHEHSDGLPAGSIWIRAHILMVSSAVGENPRHTSAVR